MNVASKDLCAKLYELSRWSGCEKHWLHRDLYDRPPRQSDLKDGQTEEDYAPAYDLGYLMWKLPSSIPSAFYKGKEAELWLRKGDSDLYHAWYFVNGIVGGLSDFGEHAEAPEDALCKLAIGLFKGGVL